MRKTKRFPYFMFFKCFNINLKTAIVTNITMGTGSFQNELQVCVLRKTMMFPSFMSFKCFNINLKTAIVTYVTLELVCVLRKKFRLIFSMIFFSCPWYQLENSNTHKCHIGTASFQNELLVCVLSENLIHKNFVYKMKNSLWYVLLLFKLAKVNIVLLTVWLWYGHDKPMYKIPRNLLIMVLL